MVQPSGNTFQTGSWRASIQLAAIILPVALAIRLYLILTCTIVSRDTVTFVRYAQYLGQSPVAAMRANDQHPLYPTLVLGLHQVRRMLGAADGPASWALSAQIVACIGGLACVVAVYLLARQLFDERVACLAALFMVFLPEGCQYSADGLSDMPHLAIYLFALTAAVRGFDRASIGYLAAAGLLSGLAYLTRPEGLGVAAVTCLALVRFPRTWSFRKRMPVAFCTLAAFLVMAGPYSVVTGKVVPKKSLKKLFHLEASLRASVDGPPAASPPVQVASLAGSADSTSLIEVLPKFIEKWARSLRVTYLLLFVGALLLPLAHRPSGVSIALLTAAAGVQTVAVLSVATSHGYFSLRHMMVLAALCLPHAAAAGDYLIGLMRDRVRWLKGPARAPLVLLAVVVGPTLPWMLEPIHADLAYYERVIDYIRKNYPRDAGVLTTRMRIPFFADHPYRIWPSTGDVSVLLGYIQSDTKLVVLDESRLKRRNPRFFEELERAAIETGLLKLVHEVPATGSAHPTRILIYEVVSRTDRSRALVPASDGR